MQDKRPSTMRPLFVTILLWLCSVVLLFVIKNVIELFTGPVAETWVDLALVLVAYLTFFLLTPLQNWMQRRARKRARQQVSSHTSDAETRPSN
ncbi:hypothetical protein C4K03_3527 [Pseudomonas synxantha]|uniref:Uncharacterized protein n=1 Tax=Pseudomonas synxantha TaxID=47883 RepID=A0A3G7U8M4_9PSED|nr:hypothetical protein [Pseudomonas synxantha]AZE55680.1 hypothetical protein C4K03_3527 [Pseudomonas synxantha]